MELNKPGQIEILLTKLNKRDRDKFPIYKMNFIYVLMLIFLKQIS